MLNVEVVESTNEGELIIERAMRSCHDHDVPMGIQPNKTFIQSIIKLGHTSPLEHAKVTFKISGVSRSLTHQLVRHRIASYTQESQRYVKMDNFEYVIPDSIKNDEQAMIIYQNAISNIQNVYNGLISRGIKKEDARYILPNACCTKIFVTMNLRELRSFIELRSDKHAQAEIRKLSDIMLVSLYKIYPIVFEDLYKKYIPDDLTYSIYDYDGTSHRVRYTAE